MALGLYGYVDVLLAFNRFVLLNTALQRAGQGRCLPQEAKLQRMAALQ